jgi:hypothetical protein
VADTSGRMHSAPARCDCQRGSLRPIQFRSTLSPASVPDPTKPGSTNCNLGLQDTRAKTRHQVIKDQGGSGTGPHTCSCINSKKILLPRRSLALRTCSSTPAPRIFPPPAKPALTCPPRRPWLRTNRWFAYAVGSGRRYRTATALGQSDHATSFRPNVVKTEQLP